MPGSVHVRTPKIAPPPPSTTASAIAEAKGRIQELHDKYRADASAELARIEGDLGSQSATLTGRTDAFKRTVLYAPKKGIVKNIRVNTLGAVVQTGQDVLEIVPVDDSLLIETRIRPAVAGDGGDITFRGFRDGIVYLAMKGACSGCPSSTATLKNGIEQLLKYYVPEVSEVRAV